jgi:hypothetical protein
MGGGSIRSRLENILMANNSSSPMR